MRTFSLSLLTGLALALPATHALGAFSGTGSAQPVERSLQAGSQDRSTDEAADAKLPFEERMNQKLAAEIQGAWMMTQYVRPDTVVPSTDVRGFAMFHDGYMTFTFQALEGSEDFFFAETQYIIQSGVFRYRIFEGRLLQVAGIQGFTNANEDYELEFSSIRIPREYNITLFHDSLELKRTSGTGFVFSRLKPGAFPEAAADQLLKSRSGYELIEDEDAFGGGGR